MRKLAILLFLSNISFNVFAQQASSDPIYDTVFVENFTDTVLNSNKWGTTYKWGPNFVNSNINTTSCTHLNPPMEMASLTIGSVNTSVNRKIDNGTCKLISTKGNNLGQHWRWDSQGNWLTPDSLPFKYKTALLRSENKFKYGYIEVRFKLQNVSLPGGANAFGPTVWMWESENGVYWSEIDLFETKGYDYKTSPNVHYEKAEACSCLTNTFYFEFEKYQQTASTWLTASMEWTPEYIDFYYDGNFFRRITDSVDRLIAMPILLDPFFPPTNFCIPIDSVYTPLPYALEFDYVKVSQVKQDCNNNKVYCNVTETSFEDKLYKSLTIGGSSCTATFNNDNVHASANDFVLLQEGFEAGNNLTMTMDIRKCGIDQSSQKVTTLPTPAPTNFMQTFKTGHP